MTKIYLIRHTQAEGNLYRMMQGHWDGDVTETGRLQIDALAERFSGVPVDAVYSSDLYRARLTASAITRTHDIPIIADRRLREINMGPWETGFFGNVFHAWPRETELFIHDPLNWHIDGAETFTQVGERAFPALKELAQRHPEQSIAVVSHGVTIRCLLSRVTGIPLSDTGTIPICKNTAVSELRYENGGFSAASINDYSHLAALPRPAWSDTADLRDESFDPRRDSRYYNACYAGAWTAAHGSLRGYNPEPYLDGAAEHFSAEPRAVLRILDGEESVGLVDLDTRRGAEEGYGWISLLYLNPEYRCKGYGIQLLARAMKLYKTLGRRSLRLHAAQDNAVAAAFYRREGFRVIGQSENSLGTLLLMEKELGGGREDV